MNAEYSYGGIVFSAKSLIREVLLAAIGAAATVFLVNAAAALVSHRPFVNLDYLVHLAKMSFFRSWFLAVAEHLPKRDGAISWRVQSPFPSRLRLIS